MRFSIDEELYNEVLKVVEKRNKTLHKRMIEEIEKLEEVKQVQKVDNDYLLKARNTKSENIKKRIEIAIETIKSDGKKVNKYNINKLTGVAYQTLKQYEDEFNL